jgi:sec-independent protein translocase protein TatC
MCLLYELGILASRFVSRPAPAESVVPEEDVLRGAVDSAIAAKMDAEMDSAEEEFRKLTEK